MILHGVNSIRFPMRKMGRIFPPFRDLSIFHSCLSQCEIAFCIGIRRIELRRAVKLLGRISIIAQLGKRYAQVIMSVCVCRIEVKRLVERFDGLGKRCISRRVLPIL